MPTIATATREEIANALNTSERECQFCGKAYTPRTHWQSFCSAKCRTAHHNEAGTREIERLQAQVSALKRQVVELQEELARRGCVEE